MVARQSLDQQLAIPFDGKHLAATFAVAQTDSVCYCYGMDFKTHFGSLTKSARATLAERCKTSVGFLVQVAYGHRRAGESLCINIERETNGAVRCEDLRPDVDWAFLRGTSKSKSKKAA